MFIVLIFQRSTKKFSQTLTYYVICMTNCQIELHITMLLSIITGHLLKLWRQLQNENSEKMRKSGVLEVGGWRGNNKHIS